ncbi:MAG: hypothetical protein QNJ54_22400 [Prochloraceae cyanobacterium]|nr:hypothetical protein [Prochloraceae cyanobacterium]
MSNLYIERQADRDLYNCLSHGRYSYILSPPDTGKTYLLYRVKSKLEKKGIKCAAIYLKTDLKKNPYIQNYLTKSHTIDSDTPNNPLFKLTKEYYWQYISDLASQFELSKRTSYTKFRQEKEKDNTQLPNKDLFLYFIDNILLNEINENEKIVIFVDEIDELLDLCFFPKKFAGDFLNTISKCYEYREKEHPDPKHKINKFNRLTFALFGETSPTREIVKDYNFNLDRQQQIKLESFKLSDFQKRSTINQLSEKYDNWEVVIRKILDWTNGQPLFTNKLFSFIVESDRNSISKDSETEINDKLVNYYVGLSEDIDKHLKKISEPLLAKPELSQLCENILQQPIISDIDRLQTQDLLEEELISLGLFFRTRNNLLKVHNLIYKKYIFHSNWIKKNRYNSHFLIKNRTYFPMSSINPQPPEPPKNQNSRSNQPQNPPQSTPTDLPGAASNLGNFFAVFSQVFGILLAGTGTYSIVTTGLSITAVLCYLIAILLLIAPRVKNRFIEIKDRITSFIQRHWKGFLFGTLGLLTLILVLIISSFNQISVIKNTANKAKDTFFDKAKQIEGLEEAIKAGDDLNKINWIKYVPILHNQLPSSPITNLQKIIS